MKMHVNWLRPEDGRMLMVCFSRREIGDRPEKSALLASPFQSQRLGNNSHWNLPQLRIGISALQS